MRDYYRQINWHNKLIIKDSVFLFFFIDSMSQDSLINDEQDDNNKQIQQSSTTITTVNSRMHSNLISSAYGKSRNILKKSIYLIINCRYSTC